MQNELEQPKRTASLLKRYPVLMLFVFALVLRVGVATGLQVHLDQQPERQFLISGDAEGYWELAQKIAAGEVYSIHQPPRYVLRMPGFPLILAAAIKIGGDSLLVARYWLALLGAVSVLFTYLLARDYFSTRIAWGVSFLVAVHPIFVGFSGVVLTESCFATALLASLWSLSRITNDSRSLLLPLLAGLLAAVAVYLRPVWILFPAIWAAVLLGKQGISKRTLVNVGLVHAALILSLSPWVYRNYQVTGQLVVTSLWVGPSLYDGLNPQATGISEMSFFDRDKKSETLTEYEVDRFYRKQAFEFLSTHPKRALELAVIKAKRFWRPWPAAEELRFLPLVWLAGLVNTGVFITVLYACWIYRRRFWLLFYSLAPILYFGAVHLIFIGSLRYRLPAEYPLMLLVGGGLVSLLCSGRSCCVSNSHSEDSKP